MIRNSPKLLFRKEPRYDVEKGYHGCIYKDRFLGSNPRRTAMTNTKARFRVIDDGNWIYAIALNESAQKLINGKLAKMIPSNNASQLVSHTK